MADNVKKKNAKKTRRKVQSSSARNRKSVSRPSAKKLQKAVVAKGAANKKQSESEKEKQKLAKTQIEAKVIAREEKARDEQQVDKESTEIQDDQKQMAKKEISQEQMIKAELDQEQAAEKALDQEQMAEKTVDQKQPESEKPEQKTTEQKQAQEEPRPTEEGATVKIKFTNENVEKRPLGDMNTTKRESMKIQHFASSNIATVLPDIVEEVAGVQPESVAQPEMPKVQLRDTVVQGQGRSIDGMMARPKASELKEQAIKKAMRETSKSVKGDKKERSYRVNFGFKRVLLALACASAAVFAIVYFVNLNAPNVSLKVAAMQSGINASYPNYVPRDYALSDITSENGKITMNFKNFTTGESFSIVEESSSWDSTALLNNYVKGEYGEDYTVVKEQGLTLYMANRGATWVNGGVVYKLKVTSGSLTKKQIKTIATSL